MCRTGAAGRFGQDVLSPGPLSAAAAACEKPRADLQVVWTPGRVCIPCRIRGEQGEDGEQGGGNSCGHRAFTSEKGQGKEFFEAIQCWKASSGGRFHGYFDAEKEGLDGPWQKAPPFSREVGEAWGFLHLRKSLED